MEAERCQADHGAHMEDILLCPGVTAEAVRSSQIWREVVEAASLTDITRHRPCAAAVACTDSHAQCAVTTRKTNTMRAQEVQAGVEACQCGVVGVVLTLKIEAATCATNTPITNKHSTVEIRHAVAERMSHTTTSQVQLVKIAENHSSLQDNTTTG